MAFFYSFHGLDKLFRIKPDTHTKKKKVKKNKKLKKFSLQHVQLCLVATIPFATIVII